VSAPRKRTWWQRLKRAHREHFDSLRGRPHWIDPYLDGQAFDEQLLRVKMGARPGDLGYFSSHWWRDVVYYMRRKERDVKERINAERIKLK